MKEDKVVEALAKHIAEKTRVTLGLMRGKSRKENIVFARCYFSHKLRALGYKYQQIADILNVTHPSIMYYIKTYENLKGYDRFNNFISALGEFGRQFLVSEKDLDNVTAELSQHMDAEVAKHIINQLRK